MKKGLSYLRVPVIWTQEIHLDFNFPFHGDLAEGEEVLLSFEASITPDDHFLDLPAHDDAHGVEDCQDFFPSSSGEMVVMGVTGETINEEMVAVVHPHVSDLNEGGSVSWY